jgi:V/A-type H+-transporting ATPase subunit I
MAIVKMSNFSLFAFDTERENLLHELQKFEYVHFNNLEDDESLKETGLRSVEVPESIVAIDEEISKVNYAIDILSKYYIRDTGLKALKKGLDNYEFIQLEERAGSIDYIPIYSQLRNLWSNKDELRQEADNCKNKIQELSPWRNINTPIRNMVGFEFGKMFIGTIPRKLKDKLEGDLLETEFTYFEVVNEDKDNLYVIALTIKAETELLNEILVKNSFSSMSLDGEDTPENEINKLESRISHLEEDIRSIENEAKNLSKYVPELELVYEYLNNKKLRIISSENFLKTDKVNLIQGYIPTDMADKFKEIVRSVLQNIYYLEIKDAEPGDPNVPILLRNSKFASTFESLTAMYALPRYNEIDPTPYLAPFYLLFFGMMGADIGYGIIMLIGTIYALKKFNLSESTRRFVGFFYYLSFSVILWGVLYGSIFGGIIPMKGLFNPAEDYNTLLVLSIIFGLIHIYFALGLKAYLSIRDGNIKDAIFDVGFWYMALTGGIVFLLSMIATLPPILKTAAAIVAVLGMLGIVATGGRSSTGIGARLGGGIYSLYGISSYVGDFVSYSRLMALGLSGGFIAGAINMMAGMLAEKGILGIIFAVVVFIIGQIFNLGLSLLGAYVHTIRLTFVEFFGKFYEGGGNGFNVFRSKPKYINLK